MQNPALPGPAPGASALHDAAVALGQGDFQRARSLAEGAAAAEKDLSLRERARLVAGVAARGAGDFAGAAAQLDFPGAHLGPLEPYHQAYLGDARLLAGDAKGAVQPFTLARSGARIEAFRVRMSGRLGDALLRAGLACDAVEPLQDGISTPETPERLWALAAAQAGCADAEAARDTRHRLWLDFPEHPAAQAAEPEQAGAATAADRSTRAARLFARGLPALALGEADKALAMKKVDGPLRARLQLLRARALFELKQRPAAAAALAATIKAAPKSEAAAEAQTLQARSAWRAGRIAEAEAAFQALAKRKDRLGDEAALLYAFIPFDRAKDDPKAFLEAAGRYQAFLKARRSARKADEASWFAAYATMRAGQREEARALFAKLASDFPRSALVPQALYWQARTSPTGGQEALYRNVIRAAPLSYYAVLSRIRLEEAGLAPEPALPQAKEPVAPPTAVSPAAELARELSAVGLVADRAEALDAAARTTNGPEGSLALASLDASLGEWGRAYALANGRLWHKAVEERDPTALALLYPRAFHDAVLRSAEAFGFDPAFVWAIMRRESAYDPLVESPARAIGLMQMLTPTARKIASILGETELPDTASLHDAERELPYAVWYLAELNGRFGHAGLAAAAYNGGPRAVGSWLERNRGLPFDEFVEAIPYRETRLYVKAVLGDYLLYRTLYPSSAPLLGHDWTLEPARPGAEF